MNIQAILKQKSIKATTARISLIEKFISFNKPLCYEDIKNYISMDKATFYRNVSTLEEAGILNAFETNSKKRYFELKETLHAHFVCLVCNGVECIKNIDLQLPDVEINNIIINGKCKNCKIA